MLGTEPADRGPLTVSGMRRSGPVLVLGFEGVTDRNAAEALRGTSLTLDAASLPVSDDPDEFYDHQLVGLAVVDAAGTVLGTVTEVMHPPAAPVLAVRPAGRLARNWCRSCRRSCRPSTWRPAAWWSIHRTECSLEGLRYSMQISVITIFPGYLEPLRESLLGRAIADEVIELAVHDLRDWTTDRHRTVDDSPYGGGPGMVMKPDVWGRAMDEVATPLEPRPPTLVVPTPAGRAFTQRRRRSWPRPSIWSSPAAGTRASTSG